MGIDVQFLQEKGQTPGQAQAVAKNFANFVRSAKTSVHMAVYHFSLKDASLSGPVIAALRETNARGVEVRIGFYDESKMAGGDQRALGGVTSPKGTQEFLDNLIAGTDIETKGIKGSHLMHNKYAICDGHTPDAAVWTGSTNFTDGAWGSMENNIVTIGSPSVCAFFENDFSELWDNGNIAGSGAGSMDSGTTDVDGVSVDVDFSPGKGKTIEQLIADAIKSVRERIKISSMVLSSQLILQALADAVNNDQVADFSGIYDGPETTGALRQAHGVTPGLFDQIKGKLVAKESKHFNPSQPDANYNYMHNKIAVCDDTVVTGSFNFSHNATQNAENIVHIHSKDWADKFSDYIDRIAALYR